MAKRGTLEHPKTLKLARRLEIPPCFALGVLESLWHWAAKYARDGRIDAEPWQVAEAIRYPWPEEKLFAALIECGWVDEVDGEMFIHDWADHADNAVKKTLANRGESFANGDKPFGKKTPESKNDLKVGKEVSGKSTPISGKQTSFSSLPEPEPEPEPVAGAPLPPTATAEIQEIETGPPEVWPPPDLGLVECPVERAVLEVMVDSRVWPPGHREHPSRAGIANLIRYAKAQAAALGECSEAAILTLVDEFRESHRPAKRNSEKPPIVVLRRWFEKAGPEWASKAAELAKSKPRPARVVEIDPADPLTTMVKPRSETSPGAKAMLSDVLGGEDPQRRPRDQAQMKPIREIGV